MEEENRDGDDMGEDNDMGEDDMLGVLNDLMAPLVNPEEPNAQAQNFYKLFGEAQSPLYEGWASNVSRLSFVTKLMKIKWENNWSNNSFTQLVKYIRAVFPMAKSLPKNYYEAKQLMKALGLHYEEIDACEDDCVLYYAELADATSCPTCKKSRWKKVYKDKKGRDKKIP
ncbi:unnamed protein product [Linum trigynum]|uniref:Transposase n=1 Tax=Linum trigynum TaxID=586398 RepID=A0AAV2FFB5_9ROSI